MCQSELAGGRAKAGARRCEKNLDKKVREIEKRMVA